VARLVARIRKASDESAAPAAPRWLPSLRQQVADTARGLARARTRLESLGADDVVALRSDVDHLMTELEEFVAALSASETGE